MRRNSRYSTRSRARNTRRFKEDDSDEESSEDQVPITTMRNRRQRVKSSSSSDGSRITAGPSSRKRRRRRQVTSSSEDSDASFNTCASKRKAKRPLMQSESSDLDSDSEAIRPRRAGAIAEMITASSDSELSDSKPIRPRSIEHRFKIVSATSETESSDSEPARPRSIEAHNIIHGAKDDKAKKVKKPATTCIDDETCSSSDSDSGEKCIICFKVLRPPYAYPSGCNHQFHPDCIRKWSGTSNTCPIDRVEYSEIIIKDELCRTIVREHVVPPPPQAFNDLEADDPTFCEVCSQHDREHEMLLCDHCEAGYHLDCLNPPLAEVPSGEWYCPQCSLVPANVRSRRRDRSNLLNEIIADATERFTMEVEEIIRQTTREVLMFPRNRHVRPRSSNRRRRAAYIPPEPTTSAMPSTSRPIASSTQRKRITKRTRRPKKKQNYRVELVTAEDGSTVEVKLGITRYKKRRRKVKKRCSRRRNEEGNRDSASVSGLMGNMATPSLDLFGNRPTLDYFSEGDADDDEEVGGGLSGLRRVGNPVRSLAGRKALAAQLLQAPQRRRAIEIAPPSAPSDLLSSILNEQNKWHNPRAQIHSDRNGDVKVMIPGSCGSRVKKTSETPQQTNNNNNGSGGSESSASTPSTSSNQRTPPDTESHSETPGSSTATATPLPPLEPPPQPPRLYDDEDFDLYADIEATPSSKLAPPPEPPAILLAMEDEGGSSPDDHLVIDDHHETYDPEKPTSPHADHPKVTDACSDILLPPSPEKKELTNINPSNINLDEIRLPSPVDEDAECPNEGMYSKASVSLARKGKPSDHEDEKEDELLNGSTPPHEEPGSPFEDQPLSRTPFSIAEKENSIYDPELISDKSDNEEADNKTKLEDHKQEDDMDSLAEDKMNYEPEEVLDLSTEKDKTIMSDDEKDKTIQKQIDSERTENDPLDVVKSTPLKGDKKEEGEDDGDDEADDEDDSGSEASVKMNKKKTKKSKASSQSPSKSIDSLDSIKTSKFKKLKYQESLEDGERTSSNNDEKLDFGEEPHQKVSYDSDDVENEKDMDARPFVEGEKDGLVDITDDEISTFEKSWEIEERPGKEKKVGLEGLETEAISENEDTLCEEAQPVLNLGTENESRLRTKNLRETKVIKEAEEGEIALDDKLPSLTWKKLSKGTKERSYREKDTSKEKSSKRKDKKTKEKRKELERYDVRKIISEKPKRPKKDEFGRDIISLSKSRSRSESRSRYKRSKERRSRSKEKSREKERERSRVKSRDRSKVKSRERSRARSRGRSRSRSQVRSRGRSRDRKRARSRSSRKARSQEKKKRKRRRKSTTSCSSCSCSSCEREKRGAKKLTVIVPNKSEESDKKSKERKREKGREKGKRGRRNRADSPVPSKEVFTSGDNILVSVNFKSSKSSERTKESSKKRRDDEGRKKKEKRSSKENQPLRSIVTTTVSVPPNMSFQRKDRSHLRNLKPVAIIDLDASPFREQTLSPKEVIVLSDSDSNEKAPSRKEKEDASTKAPLTTGPKTPPEPHIKFSISSKPPMRTLANPLLDDSAENEEQDGEEDPPEISHKGPNTPPEPPVIYDPFEPTKSRSPTPIQEIEPSRKPPTPPRDIDVVSRNVDPPKPISPPKPMEHDSPKTPSPLHSPPKQVEELPNDKPKSLPFAPVPINSVDDDSNDGGGGGGDSPYSPGSSEGDDLFEPPLPVITTPTPVAKVKPRAIQAKIIPIKALSPVKKKQKGFKSKGNSSKKEIGIKLDEDQLKILDELPNSAVEMQVKDKFLKKLNRQERVVEEVKLVLKPHYVKKHVTKEEYKEILRKSVPKICHSRSGEINPMKIQRLIEAYVKKYRHKKKKTPAPMPLLPKPKPKSSMWC